MVGRNSETKILGTQVDVMCPDNGAFITAIRSQGVTAIIFRTGSNQTEKELCNAEIFIRGIVKSYLENERRKV